MNTTRYIAALVRWAVALQCLLLGDWWTAWTILRPALPWRMRP